MKKSFVFVVSVFLTLAAGALTYPLSGAAHADQAILVAESDSHSHGASEAVTSSAAGAQRFCPITGEPINKNVYLDHKGKRVYFCCNDCKAAFEKNPDKHIEALESKGITLDKAP